MIAPFNAAGRGDVNGLLGGEAAGSAPKGISCNLATPTSAEFTKPS
jgi:hypothetical protein